MVLSSTYIFFVKISFFGCCCFSIFFGNISRDSSSLDPDHARWV